MDWDAPDEQYWVKVGSDERMHPYGMHKTVNLPDIEVVHSVIDDDNHCNRWVFIRGGAYEVWVKVAEADEYAIPCNLTSRCRRPNVTELPSSRPRFTTG